MLRRALRIALISVISVLAATAAKALTLDQSNPSVFFPLADSDQQGLAQSFRPMFAESVGAGVYIYQIGFSPRNVAISLWTDLPTLGGIELTSSTSTTTGEGWLDVSWAPTMLTPERTYFLVFQPEAFVVFAGNSSEYDRGVGYVGQTFAPTPHDFTFRTFASAIPEGSSLVYAVAGLAGLLILRRLRAA